jgi:hypothetical protein
MIQMLEALGLDRPGRRPSLSVLQEPSAEGGEGAGGALRLFSPPRQAGALAVDDWVEDYVRAVPVCESEQADLERFLSWVLHTAGGGADAGAREEYVEAVAGQPAQALSVQKQVAQARFERVTRRGQFTRPLLRAGQDLRVQLNPAHVGASVTSDGGLSEGPAAPERVIFYQLDGSTRGAAVDADVERLLRKLHSGPRRVSQLLQQLALEQRGEALEVLEELSTLGVIAVS